MKIRIVNTQVSKTIELDPFSRLDTERFKSAVSIKCLSFLGNAALGSPVIISIDSQDPDELRSHRLSKAVGLARRLSECISSIDRLEDVETIYRDFSTEHRVH